MKQEKVGLSFKILFFYYTNVKIWSKHERSFLNSIWFVYQYVPYIMFINIFYV